MFRTNLRSLVFSYGIFLIFLRNLKWFRRAGSSAVSDGSTFLVFVDFFNRLFRRFNPFGSFLISTKRFGEV